MRRFVMLISILLIISMFVLYWQYRKHILFENIASQQCNTSDIVTIGSIKLKKNNSCGIYISSFSEKNENNICLDSPPHFDFRHSSQFPSLTLLEIRRTGIYDQPREMVSSYNFAIEKIIMETPSGVLTELPEHTRKTVSLNLRPLVYYNDNLKFLGRQTLVSCEKEITKYEANDFPYGRQCYIGVPIGNDTMLSTEFYDARLPPNTWPQLLKELESAIACVMKP